MNLEIAITRGLPQAVIDELMYPGFAILVLEDVVEKYLGVKNPSDRPAEFGVNEPTFMINVCGSFGAKFCLVEVSRGTRKASQFHNALKQLNALAMSTVSRALKEAEIMERIQVFCIIELDSDVETAPGSGIYSSILESEAVWVGAAEPKAEISQGSCD